jgi:uncharacterized membrane protein (UPF0127 family)
MRFTSVLSLLLLAACSCNDSDTIPVKSSGTVTLSGVRLRALTFLAGTNRSRVPDAPIRVSGNQAALVGYGRERFIHVYGETTHPAYDVVFLDSERKVVEVASLNKNHIRGVTSSKLSQYALLLQKNWTSETPVNVGDQAAFEGSAAETPESLPVLKIGTHEVRVEYADSAARRTRGLMFRKNLGAEDGMLFIYPGREDTRNFWMKNTLTPLDIAFLKPNGEIVNVVETPIWDDPTADDGHHALSDGPCMHVLEVNFGWFRKKDLLDEAGNIKPGTRVAWPPGMPSGY